MSKFHWIAGATMISLASLAVAQEAPLTRAEVKAELARARASGELDGWREGSIDGSSMVAAKSAAGAQGRAFTSPGLSRAQVMAELASARAKGEVDRYGPEHGGRN
jgi:Domain of unknown function (DUF4148)